MRKFEVIAGGFAIVVLSASATLYLINHPLRPKKKNEIIVGAREPHAVVSPVDLIDKPFPAFNVEVPVEPEPKREEHSLVISPEWVTGTSRIDNERIVSDNTGYTLPRWSPVGLDIAFCSKDQSQLFLTGDSTAAVRKIADGLGHALHYKWNRDGMSLQVHEPHGEAAEIIITGEKYPARTLPERVFEKDGQIYYAENKSGEWRQVSNFMDDFHTPVLSPDGKLVLFQGRETGVYLARVDGSGTVKIGRGTNPTWLPDSSGIVYDVSTGDKFNPVDGDVWLARFDGWEKTNLTNSPGTLETHPDVAAGNDRIAFVKDGAIAVADLKLSAKSVARANN